MKEKLQKVEIELESIFKEKKILQSKINKLMEEYLYILNNIALNKDDKITE